MNAFGGQFAWQPVHGEGCGNSVKKALGMYRHRAEAAAAPTIKRSPFVSSRPSGNASSRYTIHGSTHHAHTRPIEYGTLDSDIARTDGAVTNPEITSSRAKRAVCSRRIA